MALKVRRVLSLLICAFVVYAGFVVDRGWAGVIMCSLFAVALFAALENG